LSAGEKITKTLTVRSRTQFLIVSWLKAWKHWRFQSKTQFPNCDVGWNSGKSWKRWVEIQIQ